MNMLTGSPLSRFAACVASLLAVPLALAGDVPQFGEPVITTRHEIQVGGKTLPYTAETGRIAIRDVETGEPHGYMFYMAYRALGAAGNRPITFVWNGGPGANSVLLHFEAAGPRRLESGRLVDNQETWLTATDLVFVDPIGTGFSRPAKPEYADEFYGTVGDVASVTEFVRAWRILHDVEHVPVLLAGESWGAGRAGSVGYQLLQRGVPVRALVLISGGTGLNREVGSDALKQALSVVDYTATAIYHGRLPENLGDSSDVAGLAVASWARETYAPALERLERLTDQEREDVATAMARFTGMPLGLIDRSTLEISPRAYREGLLQDTGQVLNVFDMRRIQQAPPSAETGSSHRQVITSYLRGTLGYRTDLPYVGTEPIEDGYAPGGEYPVSVNARWNYATAKLTPEEIQAAFEAAMKSGSGPPKMGPPLPSAAAGIELDSQLKVLVAAGRFDSLNSCAANEEISKHLEGVLKSQYRFECYAGGHMMYADEKARVRLAKHVRELALVND